MLRNENEDAEPVRLVSIRDLSRTDWLPFFQSLKGGRCLSIAIMHPAIGEQHEILSRSLEGIAFDEKKDEIQFFAEDFTHRIQKPRSIAYFENSDDGSLSIAIRDQGNMLHLIELSLPH